MIRRRRPRREIAFSFDSFLDVVANVVGIILRLILVAWAGARSYKAVVPAVEPPPPAALAEPAPPPEPTDPRAAALEQQRRELARAAALLRELLGRGQEADREAQQARADLLALAERRGRLQKEQ